MVVVPWLLLPMAGINHDGKRWTFQQLTDTRKVSNSFFFDVVSKLKSVLVGYDYTEEGEYTVKELQDFCKFMFTLSHNIRNYLTIVFRNHFKIS